METLSALIEGLSDPDRERRLFRVERLVRFGAPAVDPLRQVLRTGGLLGRCAAATALGRLGDRRAVPDLISAAQSFDTPLREQAVIALGELRDPAAVPELINAARSGNVYLINPALEALAKVGDPRALDTLVLFLRGFGHERTVRMAAARALGELGHPGGVEPLCAAAREASGGALVEICHALGALGDVRAVPALCEAAGRATEPPAVFEATRAALVRIGAVSEVAELLERDRTAPLAVRSLADFGRVAVPTLALALRHESAGVRLRALEALERLTTSCPEAGAAAAAALRDRSAEVRAEAARLVGQLQDPAYLPALLPLLGDSDRRVQGRAALALFGPRPESPELVPGLILALEDPREDQAVRAAEALAWLAREAPSNGLLAALPVLRRRGLFQRVPKRVAEARQAAAAAIDRACRSIRDLPVPAQAGQGPESLPRPASAPPASPRDLPRPSSHPENK